MKRIWLILIVLAAIIIGGCGAPYYNPQGQKLDSNDKRSPNVTKTFVNNSDQPVFVKFDKKFQQIDPGDSLAFTDKTFRERKFTVAYWYEYSFASKEEKVRIERTGMYNGDKIIVDELFLRGMMLQRGVIQNSSPEPVTVWDSQGNQYGTIKPGGYAYGQLVPVCTKFFWVSTEKRFSPRVLSSDARNIDQKENQWWQGQPIGWTYRILKSY